MRVKIADTIINFENVEKIIKYNIPNKPMFCIAIFFTSGYDMGVQYSSPMVRDFVFNRLLDTKSDKENIDKITEDTFNEIGVTC